MVIGIKGGITIDEKRDVTIITSRTSGSHTHYFVLRYPNAFARELKVDEMHSVKKKLTMEDFLEQYKKRGGKGNVQVVELTPGDAMSNEFVCSDRNDDKGYMTVFSFVATKRNGITCKSYRIQTNENPRENNASDGDELI